MKRPIVLFLLAALSLPAFAADPAPSAGNGLRVFTVGHSFHVWVAPLLNQMALAAGLTEHKIAGVSSIGGSTVQRHWVLPDEKNPAKTALRGGNVDVLTLAPIWLPDDGMEKFATLAVEHNPAIRITIQEYWLPNDEYNPVYPLDTRKKVDHNATQIPVLREAQNRYDHDIDEHAKSLNQKLGKDVIVTVPVGQAVVALREKIVAGQCPGIKTQTELFTDSWGHVFHHVKLLSAYCHFAVIYQRTPVGLPVPPQLAKDPKLAPGEAEALNTLLQQLAWEAVIEHPMSGVKAAG